MADDFDLFKTAPAEVIRYFDAKHSRPTFDWRDVAPEEHAFAWTVAKSAGFDILDDIRSAMRDAIVHQLPFEQFRQSLTPVLQRKGWWGRQKVVDPADGTPQIVQLGSPRRLHTIYWSNVRSAYAAGEWEKTQRTKRFLPFLVYLLSVSIDKRIEHEAWVGIVLPVDDPFWDTHYPPNGWGCKCRIRQISRREAERLGWREGQEAPVIVAKPWYNKRTGETVWVPDGIDPGWENNPGKFRQQNVSDFLYGKVDAMPAHRQDVAVQDIVGSPAMEALVRGKLENGSYLPVAQISPTVVQAFDAKTPLIRLSASSVGHIIKEHAERELSTDDFRQAISVLRNPEAVVRRGKSAAFVGIAKGEWWRVIVKSANDGLEWWLSSFHRKSDKDVRSFIRAASEKQQLVE
ncbi:phage minor head protein [Brucella anthropi]|uniref:phage head morphogenesis protein n=1 Tax=Brucella anthropi TaxID=529 RepID=UPI002362BEBD|nr:phage minor head protein [Brucella anthropi]